MTLTRQMAVLLMVSMTASLSAGDWSQWRGNRRNGIAEDSPAIQVAPTS